MLILFYWRTVLVVVSSSAEAVVVSMAEPNFYKKGLKKVTNFVVVTNFTFFSSSLMQICASLLKKNSLCKHLLVFWA